MTYEVMDTRSICKICGDRIDRTKNGTQCHICRDLIIKEKARLMKLITKRAQYNVWKIRRIQKGTV